MTAGSPTLAGPEARLRHAVDTAGGRRIVVATDDVAALLDQARPPAVTDLDDTAPPSTAEPTAGGMVDALELAIAAWDSDPDRVRDHGRWPPAPELARDHTAAAHRTLAHIAARRRGGDPR